MLWWSKKKPAEESSREVEIIDRIIASMEEHPDKWDVDDYSCWNRFIHKEPKEETKGCKANYITIKVANNLYLALNGATLEITSANQKRLKKTCQELVKEKLLRSLIRADELASKD